MHDCFHEKIYYFLRWCLFPTHTPKRLIKVRPEEAGKQGDEAITWFRYVYPRTKTAEWPKDCAPVSIFAKCLS